jgi:hypothetical protein|eukprot:COSAG06_NODE_397_length_16244_cov_230.792320_9_plen_51_part_00
MNYVITVIYSSLSTNLKHLLRCVGPTPPARVFLGSSSSVSEGALCLSKGS